MGFIIISLLGLVIVYLAIRRARARGKQVHALGQRGIAAQAKVVRKWRKLVGSGRRETALMYRFSARGEEFAAETLETRNTFTHLEPGDALEIYYLPENPAVSAPAWLVDEVRRMAPS